MRFHPLRLITVVSPEQPHPFAPQPTAIRRRITATTGESAGAPATVLSPHGFCRSDSPSRLPDPDPVRGADPCFVRAFTCSTREPGLGSCCLYAGHHLGRKRISPRFIPGD